MTINHDPDWWYFHGDNNQANDSPVESDWWRDCPKCQWCKRPIDEDRGCQDADCVAERSDEQ